MGMGNCTSSGYTPVPMCKPLEFQGFSLSILQA